MSDPSPGRALRVAVVQSHAIQYFVPLYRMLAQEPGIELTVLFGSRQNVDGQVKDPSFGRIVTWDVPMLDGYRSIFLCDPPRDHGVKGRLQMIRPRVIRELWRGRFDVVVIQGHEHVMNLLALVAARLFGINVLYRGETSARLAGSSGLQKRRRWFARVLDLFVDGYLAIGSWNRDFYLQAGVDPSRIVLAPYATEHGRFDAARRGRARWRGEWRRRLGVSRDAVLLLVVSSLIPRKRVGDAVAAWTLLRSRGIECELVIAGDGALRAELESSVATSSWRSAVHFLGFTNQSELPGLYASADVFVFPSESDTWGLVVNEAMASGLPVVCADAVSASRDIVRSGVTGFTYTAGDVPALAGALSRVLEGRDSEAMREASAELISRWSLAETKAGYLQGIHRFGIDPERLNRD